MMKKSTITTQEANKVAAKMLRKINAWRKGKNVKVTIPNPSIKEGQKTNQQFVTYTGRELWGDHQDKYQAKGVHK